VERTSATGPAGRRGRKAGLPATTAIAQELRRRGEMLHLTVRAAAARTGVPFSVICEIERGRRVPSLTTYAKLRQGLGLEVPPTVLLPPRVDAALLEEHLAALAAR
jgi:transcriptional regulator with XRE-family HTH domain